MLNISQFNTLYIHSMYTLTVIFPILFLIIKVHLYNFLLKYIFLLLKYKFGIDMGMEKPGQLGMVLVMVQFLWWNVQTCWSMGRLWSSLCGE